MHGQTCGLDAEECPKGGGGEGGGAAGGCGGGGGGGYSLLKGIAAALRDQRTLNGVRRRQKTSVSRAPLTKKSKKKNGIRSV